MHNINTINKLGFIPAILNHEKKLICKKYIKKNINIIPTIEINFFNTSPSSYYYFVITSTVSNFEKSTAVSMIAYLFVIFLVFTTCLIVPIWIPLG